MIDLPMNIVTVEASDLVSIKCSTTITTIFFNNKLTNATMCTTILAKQSFINVPLLFLAMFFYCKSLVPAKFVFLYFKSIFPLFYTICMVN